MSSISLNLNSSTSSSTSSGIDVTSVVYQILYAERAPERLWQAQQASLTLQATALNTISSDISTLQDKANSLKDIFGGLSGKTVTSSQPSILTASAQTSAPTGSHIVVVENLASTASYYTDPLTNSTTTIANGTFQLQVGQGTASTITVDSSNNTLDTLASYINTHGYGVVASVVNDASGSRLALVSKTSGVPGDLTISSNTSGLAFHKSITGKNASLTVDGVPVSSASNTVSTALAGVTLNLAGASPDTEVALNVSPDTAQAAQAVNDLVDAYNTAISAINSQFTVDATTGNQGPLASNSALRSLQASILSDATYSISGNNGYSSLASMGITMADDGTLSVDSTQLNDVVSNHFTDFQNFFQSITPTGFAYHLSTDLSSITSPSSSLIALNLSENTSSQKLLSDQITNLEDRLAVRQEQLITQYSRVDTMLRQYSVVMAQVTGQLASLPKY